MSFLAARKKAGLTQAAVAERLNIAAASVCQWEKGKTLPESARLTEIAKLYNCTVDDLLKPDPAED